MALHELANQIFYRMGYYISRSGVPARWVENQLPTTTTTLAFKNHRDGFLEKRALQYTATAEL